MKKSKLIALLNQIKGDPDIVLWNGMVGDWMDVNPKLIEGELVKQSFETAVRMYEFEKKRDKNDFDYVLPQKERDEYKKSWRKHWKWEDNEFVTKDDIASGSYLSKRVVYIDAKKRGVHTWDRLGDIDY